MHLKQLITKIKNYVGIDIKVDEVIDLRAVHYAAEKSFNVDMSVNRVFRIAATHVVYKGDLENYLHDIYTEIVCVIDTKWKFTDAAVYDRRIADFDRPLYNIFSAKVHSEISTYSPVKLKINILEWIPALQASRINKKDLEELEQEYIIEKLKGVNDEEHHCHFP